MEEAKVFKKRETWLRLYVEDMKIEEGDIHFFYIDKVMQYKQVCDQIIQVRDTDPNNTSP